VIRSNFWNRTKRRLRKPPALAGGGLAAAVDLSRAQVAPSFHDFPLHRYARAPTRGPRKILKSLPQADFPHLFCFSLRWPSVAFPQGEGGPTTAFLQKMPLGSRRQSHRWGFLATDASWAAESLDMSGYDLVIFQAFQPSPRKKKKKQRGVNHLRPISFTSVIDHSARHASSWTSSKTDISSQGCINGGPSPGWRSPKLVAPYIRGPGTSRQRPTGVDSFPSPIPSSSASARKSPIAANATTIYPPVIVRAIRAPGRQRRFLCVTASPGASSLPSRFRLIRGSGSPRMPDKKKLVVIGPAPRIGQKSETRLPQRPRLARSPSNETITDYLPTRQGFLFAAEEDFGIVPVEAMGLRHPRHRLSAAVALEPGKPHPRPSNWHPFPPPDRLNLKKFAETIRFQIRPSIQEEPALTDLNEPLLRLFAVPPEGLFAARGDYIEPPFRLGEHRPNVAAASFHRWLRPHGLAMAALQIRITLRSFFADDVPAPLDFQACPRLSPEQVGLGRPWSPKRASWLRYRKVLAKYVFGAPSPDPQPDTVHPRLDVGEDVVFGNLELLRLAFSIGVRSEPRRYNQPDNRFVGSGAR